MFKNQSQFASVFRVGRLWLGVVCAFPLTGCDEAGSVDGDLDCGATVAEGLGVGALGGLTSGVYGDVVWNEATGWGELSPIGTFGSISEQSFSEGEMSSTALIPQFTPYLYSGDASVPEGVTTEMFSKSVSSYSVEASDAIDGDDDFSASLVAEVTARHPNLTTDSRVGVWWIRSHTAVTENRLLNFSRSCSTALPEVFVADWEFYWVGEGSLTPSFEMPGRAFARRKSIE